MADNSNTSNENSESVEKIWNDKKILLKNEFLKEFKNDYNTKKPKDKISFLNKIKGSDILSIKPYLEKFKKYQESIILLNNNNFGAFDLDKISIIDIKNTFRSDLFKLDVERNILKSYLFSDYCIDEDNYSNIFPEIEKLDFSEIYDLKKSKKARKDFLIKVFWWLGKLPLEKNKKDILENILKLKDNLDNIEDTNDKNKLLEILQVLDNRNKLSWFTSNVKVALFELLELSFICDAEKVWFLRDFIPVIWYDDLKHIWFDVNQVKEEIIKNIYSDSEIKELWIDNLRNDVNLNNLFIETSKLSDSNLLSLFKWSIDLRNKIIDNFSENYDIQLNIWKEKDKDNWPSTLWELSKKLEKNWEKLIIEEWRILKIIEKDKEWKQKISYIKIIKWDDEKRELTILPIWDNSEGEETINLKVSINNSKPVTYLELSKALNKENISLESYSLLDIKNKISDEKDTLKSSSLYLYNSEDLENEENREKLTDIYTESLKDEILELREELENDIELDKWKNSRIFLEERIKLLEGDLEEIDDQKILDFLNLRELLNKIDNIDPEWKKLWLVKWLFLETEKWSFEVMWVDDGFVVLKSMWWVEKLSFEDFFTAFKKNKTKRYKKINDFWELIDNFKWEDKGWNKYKFKDWEIIVENLEDKKDEKVDYFTSEKNDKIVKINSISWDKITFQCWERKWSDQLEKGDKNYNKDGWEILYINWADEVTLTLNEFSKYIKDNELYPNVNTGKNKKEEAPEDLKNDFKGWFLDRVFKRISIAELIAWGKIFIDSLTETMKKWNDVHSAHVALALWKFLPEEVRAELKIKVEQAESEEMEKAIKWLWDVDSKDAIKRIRWWLLNKDTPEYKKEAGLMFVMKKYWTLTWKAWLYQFKWKFLWYEALWWRKNDKLFLEIKEEYEDKNPPQAFTEEKLIHILLARQCWWSIKPHRRSRLHKEFENNWKTWMKEEAEKWYNDASNFRNAKDMVKWGNWELVNWNLPNAVGWYKKAI